VTTLGAFGVVTVRSGGNRDADGIEEYRGMFWDRPWLAGAFTAALLSLAGIPLTAGFPGKFYIVAAGVRSGATAAVLVLAAGSAMGLYYYLRVIVAIFARGEGGERASPRANGPPVPLPGSVVLAALTVLLIALGVFPAPWMQLIRETVAGLFP
ncbi:MAG TPA: proton-conducting transporter membrane subunit, partial [Candidatus Aquicultoraceae bacterium]|nr:proton-conducting transporter membrane subunit [Candidatus Aquicultoraceae bacterium]